MKQYDLIVIGGGGGTKLVSPAAKLGLKVAIVEKEKLGGTCLNRGCIPSKMLIHAADVATIIREAHRFEIAVGSQPEVYFEELIRRVNSTIDEESESIVEAYAKNPLIDFYHGHGRFVGSKQIQVGDEILTADKIFIPVGARAKIPKIEGLSAVPFMTYREALRNPKKPKRLVVIGGGYIACELGYFYAALGVETTFLVRSCFLRHEDEEVQRAFAAAFTKKFDVRQGAKPLKVSFDGATYTIDYAQEGKTHRLECDALLVAAGVVASTADLGLEKTGVELTAEGFVKVDPYLETTAPGIYCFGDAIGRNLYRHTANFEGEYLFRQLYGGEPKTPIDYSPVPHAVFSHPQIGAVGKTEEQLKEEGVDYIVGNNPYSSSAMGMALRSEEGFCKLLFDRNTKKLLGGHILGDEASDMIHMVIAFMNMGATLDDMLKTIYIHPALPEIVRNAARKAREQLEYADSTR